MKHTLRFLGLSLLLSSFTMTGAKPLEKIPSELHDKFTLNGQIPVLDYYIDGTYESTDPIHFSKQQIEKLIERVKRQECFHYNETDSYLYEALREHAIQGQTVAIMGTVEPVYESIALAYGAQPTTIEYQKLTTSHPQLRCLTVEEFENNPEQFDAAFSISSFEHDGLGRYGDPINPFGDLEAMKKMKSIVKKGGLLYLAIPVGADCLCWNAHRVYGRVRLPMMFEGWELVGSYGFNESMFDLAPSRVADQPVFVLRNV